jgi:hypothetical protein
MSDRRQQTAAAARALQAGGRPFEPGTAHPQGLVGREHSAVCRLPLFAHFDSEVPWEPRPIPLLPRSSIRAEQMNLPDRGFGSLACLLGQPAGRSLGSGPDARSRWSPCLSVKNAPPHISQHVTTRLKATLVATPISSKAFTKRTRGPTLRVTWRTVMLRSRGRLTSARVTTAAQFVTSRSIVTE